MSMKYIREYYNVPAKRGMKVNAQGHKGVIVGSRGPYLRIKIQGEKNILSFHPTWEMEYLKEKEKMGEQIEENEIIDFRSGFMHPVEKEEGGMMYSKSCSISGLWCPCLECMYYCNPIGCKHFRDMFKAEIVYQRVSGNLVELIIGRFLGK